MSCASGGHDPAAVDLPSEDESAGWWEYADAVVEAIADGSHRARGSVPNHRRQSSCDG
jgi:hypothetical protein